MAGGGPPDGRVGAELSSDAEALEAEGADGVAPQELPGLLVVEAGLKPFDIVALIPIIENAGGRITTWDGKPATQGGRIVAAGDPHLHAQAVKALSG